MPRAGLTFDPASGLTSPDTEDIRASVAADWTGAFNDPELPALDTDPTTPAGQLIDAEVAEIEAKNAALLFLAGQFNPKIASGRFQDALGYIYFMTRKIAEPTIVTCQVTGLNGTVIPYGALAQSANGYTLICNAPITITNSTDSGDNETTFRVSEWGPIDIPPHSVNKILTVIPGWDTVDNAAAGAIGRNVESRAEFEARRRESVAMNAHGSVAALYGWLADIDGVLDVAVLENVGPDPVVKFGVTVPGHGVTICVYGGDNADIAEAIYNKVDNGCDFGGNTALVYTDDSGATYDYLILRPDTMNFWVNVTVGADVALTAAMTAAIQQAVVNDFAGLNTASGNPRVKMASTVYASRFYAAAMAVEGVNALQSIGIALSASPPGAFALSLDVPANIEPVISAGNVIVTREAG
jgi:uncharacterized phage protein gp47/JayE